MSSLGRFAPSPSGRLHMGSLLTAYASYLRARSTHASFVLRLEDLDLPRCKAVTLPLMLRELMLLGLHSDVPILVQSHDLPCYYQAIQQLITQDQAFYCACTRSQLKDEECHCQALHLSYHDHYALRTDLSAYLQHYPYFDDLNLGRISQQDFQLQSILTLLRSDDIIAYNLAVVVDDHRQGVTEIVRGADMLEASFLQLALYEIFGYPAPDFLHIPLLTDAQGHKLSKQNHAPAALAYLTPAQALTESLSLLGQENPETKAQLLQVIQTEKVLEEQLERSVQEVAQGLQKYGKTQKQKVRNQILKSLPCDARHLLLACECGLQELPLLKERLPEDTLSLTQQEILHQRQGIEESPDLLQIMAQLLQERDPQLIEKGQQICQQKALILEEAALGFRCERLPKNHMRWYNAP